MGEGARSLILLIRAEKKIIILNRPEKRGVVFNDEISIFIR